MSDWAAGQEEVDGAGLALAVLLLDELDAVVHRHVLAHDRHRAVGAGGGDDDDLDDLDAVEMLVEQGGQQVADVGLFVVGGDADAAANLFRLGSCQ